MIPSAGGGGGGNSSPGDPYALPGSGMSAAAGPSASIGPAAPAWSPGIVWPDSEPPEASSDDPSVSHTAGSTR